MSQTSLSHSFAAVAIGRNEGQRLHRCLESLLRHFPLVVYVDSGSSDGSVEFARSVGAQVVELDLQNPFTAARARNAGLALVRAQCSALQWVQFIDGDCELCDGWVSAALQAIEAHPQLGVVCGRRRERNPGRSAYNQLCDIEWDTPVGLVHACGGDALMRASAVADVGGYRDSLIAGEEPELCFRLRKQGWQVLRLDADMTLHDADMTKFPQWWKRSQRAGHAFAEHAFLHGSDLERMGVRETSSSVLWSGATVASVLLPPLLPLTATVAGATALRIFLRQRNRGLPARHAWLYAGSCLLGKLPQTLGAAQFVWRRFWGQASTLIEYK